jgi:hypothetical protein
MSDKIDLSQETNQSDEVLVPHKFQQYHRDTNSGTNSVYCSYDTYTVCQKRYNTKIAG